MTLNAGGAEGRKQAGGWASWSQLWPAVASGATGASGSFDVSDVGTTNFPEIECTYSNQTHSCVEYTEYPSWNIAGIHVGGGRKTYIQVKAAPGEEAAAEAALRAKMKQSGIEAAHNVNRIIVIPVKYDYGELWRWQVILNRFALSSGNTVGITGANVGQNRGGYEVVVFPLSSLQDARDNISDLRETIHVLAVDPQSVVDVLPTLLPQLGIPVDAVGVVGKARGLRPELVQSQPLDVAPSLAEEAASGSNDSPTNAPEVLDEVTGKVADDGTANLGAAREATRDAATVRSEKSALDGVDVDDNVMLSSEVNSDVEEEASQVAKRSADSGVSPWLLAGISGAVGIVIVTSAMYLTGVVGRRRA